jgi:hypothetical protein
MTDIRTWEEMSVVEQLQSEYWDFYKSVHGIRPRHLIGSENWNSEEWLTEAMKSLSKEAEVIWAAEAEDEKKNVETFEASVQKLMKEMNKDRTTILRWMMNGSDCNGDWDYYCYQLGIPYGYFKEIEKCISVI